MVHRGDLLRRSDRERERTKYAMRRLRKAIAMAGMDIRREDAVLASVYRPTPPEMLGVQECDPRRIQPSGRAYLLQQDLLPHHAAEVRNLQETDRGGFQHYPASLLRGLR